MTGTTHFAASDLGKLVRGSYRAHEQLVDAALDLLALYGVPATPIHTGPRVAPRAGGGFDLRPNRRQAGLSDVFACIPPTGRLALLEMKTGKASRSREQQELRDRYMRAGADCLLIRGIAELHAYLKQQGLTPGTGGIR